jgi:hypothetical protein
VQKSSLDLKQLKNSGKEDNWPLFLAPLWNILVFYSFTPCDPRFGVDYPGRIPGQIPANVIRYFTEPGDLVVDLMAGGGITIWV